MALRGIVRSSLLRQRRGIFGVSLSITSGEDDKHLTVTLSSILPWLIVIVPSGRDVCRRLLSWLRDTLPPMLQISRAVLWGGGWTREMLELIDPRLWAESASFICSVMVRCIKLQSYYIHFSIWYIAKYVRAEVDWSHQFLVGKSLLTISYRLALKLNLPRLLRGVAPDGDPKWWFDAALVAAYGVLNPAGLSNMSVSSNFTSSAAWS